MKGPDDRHTPPAIEPLACNRRVRGRWRFQARAIGAGCAESVVPACLRAGGRQIRGAEKRGLGRECAHLDSGIGREEMAEAEHHEERGEVGEHVAQAEEAVHMFPLNGGGGKAPVPPSTEGRQARTKAPFKQHKATLARGW